ncbi:hypothetical protein [Modestobacter sp. SYSU DS0290]
MTENAPTDGPDAGARDRATRRRAALAAGVVVVVAAVVLALVLGRGSGESGGAAAGTATAAPSSGAAASSSAPATEGPAASEAPVATPEGDQATGDLDAPPPSLAAVQLDEPVVVDEVTLSVVSVEAIDGTGVGVGNVAGPALRVTVRARNGTEAPQDLDAVSVNLSTGADETPASPLRDPSAAPFAGTLAPGDTAEGVYVFSVPVAARDMVTVEVGHRPGAPVAVFRGAAR